MGHWSNLFPLIFFPFKIIVLGVGMYFSIKWHHDRAQEEKDKAEKRKIPPESTS